MKNLRNATPQITVHFHHLWDGRLVGPYEGVAHFAHNTAHRSVMNVGIDAIQVAHGFCQTTPYRFKDKPFVVRIGAGPRHRQTQFEWHIETGSPTWRIAVKLDAGQVMNRIRATFDERGYAV